MFHPVTSLVSSVECVFANTCTFGSATRSQFSGEVSSNNRAVLWVHVRLCCRMLVRTRTVLLACKQGHVAFVVKPVRKVHHLGALRVNEWTRSSRRCATFSSWSTRRGRQGAVPVSVLRTVHGIDGTSLRVEAEASEIHGPCHLSCVKDSTGRRVARQLQK